MTTDKIENEGRVATRQRSKKAAMVEGLRKSLGNVSAAAEWAGVSRRTYYNWLAKDPKFAEACEEVTERQKDYVEGQLLKLIQAANPTAIIFYLKTRCKERGYTERGDAGVRTPTGEPKLISESLRVRIEEKKRNIIRLLQGEGKFTPELVNQIEAAAQVEVKRDMLAAEIFSEDYTSVIVEYSREGSVRQSVNPKERLFIDYSSQLQKLYKALGMNTDSKERALDGGDTAADFLGRHRMEGDD